MKEIKLNNKTYEFSGKTEDIRKLKDDPIIANLQKVVNAYLKMLNNKLPDLVRTTPVSAFGDNNNRLDPLNFNGQMNTKYVGKACSGQACVNIPLIGKVCTPDLCAEAIAKAALLNMTGLSFLKISLIDIKEYSLSETLINANLDITCLIGGISLNNSFLTASCGVLGIDIPVGAAIISGTISDINISTNTNISIDKNTLKITELMNSSCTVNFGNLSIQATGLSLLDILNPGITSSMTQLVTANIIDSGQINSLIKQFIDDSLKKIAEEV